MRKLLVFLILLSAIVAIPLPYLIHGIGQADFIAYWSAARLFVTGKNPYNLSNISDIQIQEFPERQTNEGDFLIVAWNPPLLNLLLSPLGMVTFKTAVHIWLFVNLFLIGISVLISWDLSSKPFDNKGFIYILLISLLFIEVLISLIIGQITSIILTSLLLSYWLLKKKMDYLAGIALAFSTIKLHLIYFPLLLILLWSTCSRRWKLISGFLSAILFSSVIMWIFLPEWISDYIQLLSNLPNYSDTTSTLGNLFRSLIGINGFNYTFILVLPMVIPFLRSFNIFKEIAPINASILISIFFAPYGFGVDHILALPSFIQIYSWIRKKQLPIGINITFAVIYFMCNALIIIFLLLRLPVYWGSLFPLLYLIVYIYGWKLHNQSQSKFFYEISENGNI